MFNYNFNKKTSYISFKSFMFLLPDFNYNVKNNANLFYFKYKNNKFI